MKSKKDMTPKIKIFKETKLIGKKLKMFFANDNTFKLWQSFMPYRSEIKNQSGSDLYSVNIYNRVSFFESFNATHEYDKWAAVAVQDFDEIPESMQTLIIPEGLYAVFHYVGRPSDAQPTFGYIYGEWLPKSGYEIDDRPYFALMDEKYKGEDPLSEEEFWVPIKQHSNG
ncbi:MAG: GyrI-like domain-containing protein [Flavobacterium sp.]